MENFCQITPNPRPFFLQVVRVTILNSLLVFIFSILLSIIMQTGTVKFFNEAKGYGFIVEDDSNRDIFVHVTGLGGLTIRENDQR